MTDQSIRRVQELFTVWPGCEVAKASEASTGRDARARWRAGTPWEMGSNTVSWNQRGRKLGTRQRARRR
ncbi:hypothetical protein M0R45_010165 [Rubus argutus]|uniref:Uncharacterized protein n=1 Tax=Rubus argutus TaxID=59490 RepID=A0AAW1Y6K5_RUBAR